MTDLWELSTAFYTQHSWQTKTKPNQIRVAQVMTVLGSACHHRMNKFGPSWLIILDPKKYFLRFLVLKGVNSTSVIKAAWKATISNGKRKYKLDQWRTLKLSLFSDFTGTSTVFQIFGWVLTTKSNKRIFKKFFV